MNRGYDYALFKDVFMRLKKTNLKLIVHVMNGYPTESVEQMIETIKVVGQLRPYGIKIHMLNVLKNSNLGMQYTLKPFKLLSLEEYIYCVVTQLRYIPKEVSILRLTGDYSHEDLIEPVWIKNKIMVLNGIDKKMALLNITQGDLCV